jgi:hypothetical protein
VWDTTSSPNKYSDVPLKVSKKILIEKYNGDIEMNKDINQSIYLWLKTTLFQFHQSTLLYLKYLYFYLYKVYYNQ